jgi:hypothetical protein
VRLRTGGRVVDVVGEARRVAGPSPPPWLAGAALLATAVVAVDLDDPTSWEAQHAG